MDGTLKKRMALDGEIHSTKLKGSRSGRLSGKMLNDIVSEFLATEIRTFTLHSLPPSEYITDHISQRHQCNLDHVPTKWIASIKRKSVRFSQLKNGKCPCLLVLFSRCVCFARLFVLLLVIVVDIVVWLDAVAAITLPTISDKCFMLLVCVCCMCATTIVYIRSSHKLTMPLKERERGFNLANTQFDFNQSAWFSISITVFRSIFSFRKCHLMSCNAKCSHLSA